MAKTKQEVSIQRLETIFGEDKELMLFFLTWIKHGRNATKAYLEMHPGSSVGSASVLGSRALARVNIEAVLVAYEIGPEQYFTQLKDGMGASKWNDFTGEREADHKTRKDYHDKVGKLLGIEKVADQAPQIAFFQKITVEKENYGI